MTNSEVWKKVEDLRAEHEILSADKIPLDLISFVELELRLDLIPYDLLKADFGADAEIRSKTAELIAPRFGVHPIAIETRFDREGIWPSPF